MMTSILDQIKQRRLTLGLKQNDMLLRVGISRQQYQRLESKGNPRLDTLELIAKGLNSELMLIPKEKLGAVMALLEQDEPLPVSKQSSESGATDVSQAKKRQRTRRRKVFQMIRGRVCWGMTFEPTWRGSPAKGINVEDWLVFNALPRATRDAVCFDHWKLFSEPRFPQNTNSTSISHTDDESCSQRD